MWKVVTVRGRLTLWVGKLVVYVGDRNCGWVSRTVIASGKCDRAVALSGNESAVSIITHPDRDKCW